MKGDVLAYGREEVERAAEAVRARTGLAPRIALILGSGLGAFADRAEGGESLDYAAIPGFPVSTVEGHSGRLVLGNVAGVPVAAQQGRFHVYEGYAASQVTFPLRVMRRLGAEILIVTNAAGGVDPRLLPGDLMVIEDHLNLQFRSPLRGRGPIVDRDRFVDLSAPYSPRLQEIAFEAAYAAGIRRFRAGTYCGLTGPAYETPAEIRMLRSVGADAVGMSTVPEVVAARHLGMEVLGISCITNLASGVSPEPLDHAEVIEVTREVRERFTRLLSEILARIGP